MNELKIFENPEFGKVRTIEDGGKFLFCGSDVAKALGYLNSRKALSDHCRYVTKCYAPHPQNPNKQIEMSFVPEGDVYRLIAHSKLPNAEKFESWVFDDVLPTIRNQGMYITPAKVDELVGNPDILLKIITNYKLDHDARLEAERKVSEQQKIIAEYRPKVMFANSVSASDDCILVGTLAKLMCQNGFNIGQNRLFALLRQDVYLMTGGERHNLPTQKAMDLGLFKILERTIINADGSVKIVNTTVVTGKGQQYLMGKYLRLEKEIASEVKEGVL